MTAAADLYALQQVDLALDRARERLSEIEESLGETEELVQARAEAEEKGKLATELRSRQTELEWSVDEARAKAGEIETKLYGGTVRNPKELSDLQADLNQLKTQLRTREDALLGLLVEIEDAETELAAAESAHADIEATWRSGQAALQEERAQIEPEVQRLEGEKETLSAGLDKGSLSLYNLLRERRAGRAVATVERGMCQGCRITLPMSVLQKARSAMGLVQCVSCERILLVS